MKPEYLVYTLITFDLGIALVYGFQKDFGRVGYWMSAASITFSTLWMK